MRRLVRSRFIAVLILGLLGLAGCGGGSQKDPKAGVPTSISFSPSSLSLTVGGVQGLTAQVLDGNGAAISTAKITFSSSNTTIATVSSAGLVCAGTWDANNIVCTPGPVGNTQITITSGSLTANVPVFTHQRVDTVQVTPSRVDCRSVGQTQQMSAQAFSNGVDITSTVGPFAWGVLGSTFAAVDTRGIVTALQPGTATVFAAIANVTSVPVTFVTCGVRSINIHVSGGSNTSFSLSSAGTQQLAADVVDTAGVAISPTLVWSTSQPVTASVNGSGLVTAAAAGTSGIVASCSSLCNSGLAPIYSNVVVASVSGSSTTTVYATGTGATSLVPIDTSTNTAGTAITLPATPNSFLFNRQGTKGYLGSSGGLMVLDTATNTVTNNSSAPGKVLAVSPAGTQVLVGDTNAVYVVTTLSVQALSIAGATAADFAPDSTQAFIVAGSTLYAFQQSGALRPIPLVAGAPDVAFLASGAFAYLAGGAPSAATARATCDNSLSDTVPTNGNPGLLRALPDGSGMVAADSPGLDVITATTDRAGCPPTLSDARVFQDFGQGAFTARQLIVLPNGSKVFVTSNLGQLLVYDVAGGTTSTISLANGASAFTGGAKLDSSTLYVGASDNAVHRIDVSAGADAQQISLSFTPDLVAVRPK